MEVVKVGVLVVVGEKLIVCASFGDPALLDVNDLVSIGDGEQVVRDDDRGTAGDESA
jgi:hypothetical protein